MGKYQGRGIMGQCLAQQFPGMEAGTVQGAVEQFLKSNYAVAVIQLYKQQHTSCGKSRRRVMR